MKKPNPTVMKCVAIGVLLLIGAVLLDIHLLREKKMSTKKPVPEATATNSKPSSDEVTAKFAFEIK